MPRNIVETLAFLNRKSSLPPPRQRVDGVSNRNGRWNWPNTDSRCARARRGTGCATRAESGRRSSLPGYARDTPRCWQPGRGHDANQRRTATDSTGTAEPSYWQRDPQSDIEGADRFEQTLSGPVRCDRRRPANNAARQSAADDAAGHAAPRSGGKCRWSRRWCWWSSTATGHAGLDTSPRSIGYGFTEPFLRPPDFFPARRSAAHHTAS